MNAAMDYIEANLAGEIDMKAAAGRACCSEYHFTRFFSYIADMPLSEYIRQRRLTLAGFMIRKSNARIIDIANTFGYNSPNSFTRAFQVMHGVTPSEARSLNIELKCLPRLYFNITVSVDKALEYRIVDDSERAVFGISFITKSSEAYETIPRFIDKCEEDGVTLKIVRAGKGNETTLLSSLIFDLDDFETRYMLCLNIPEGGIPDGFEAAEIPAGTWAVFPLVIEKPEDSIISIWKRIRTEWFPSSGYELREGPRQERCYWREDGKMLVEAWVPIVKRPLSD